jgi:hypothetical protein
VVGAWIYHGCMDADVGAAGRNLILAAVKALGQQGIVPRRRRRAWIEVGRDYAGSTLMALPEFEQFERAVRESYPDRFDAPFGERELAQEYAFSLVEGAIARAVDLDDEDVASSAGVSIAVEELHRLLTRNRDDVIVARVITDVWVEAPLRIGDVEVRPVGDWGLRDAFIDIDRLIPGAGATLEAETSFGPFTFQFAILVTLASAPVGDPIHPGYYMAAREASNRLATALAAIRLATAATTDTVVEVVGPPGYVRLRRPRAVRHDYNQARLIQRIGRVTLPLAPAIGKLKEQLVGWGGDDTEPHIVGVALARYDRSFLERPWFDLVVDIGVGLEAALLGGGDHEEISLRLRSRAATLLATSDDSPAQIYEDVKRLYNLRSDIVHGSNLTQKEIEKELHRISTTNRTGEAGVKGALALDRGRDILRRAILARALLIQDGRWPAGKQGKAVDLDGALIEPAAQEDWRRTWRLGLEAIGLGFAADEASVADLHVALPARGQIPTRREGDADHEGL